MIHQHRPYTLDLNKEILRMAKIYIRKGIIPVKMEDDALHIAVSAYYEMDILLSWNYKHLANVFKKKRIMAVNLEEGYGKLLEMTTPWEVLQDDNKE